eukprot:2906031-Rhodomonas_salina.1
MQGPSRRAAGSPALALGALHWHWHWQRREEAQLGLGLELVDEREGVGGERERGAVRRMLWGEQGRAASRSTCVRPTAETPSS